jgi:hypothetical protein
MALATGLPALTAYTREPAPVFRLFADMRGAGPSQDVVVAMHRRGYADTRRVRGWVGPAGFPWRLLDAPSGHEWLELVRYWREGGAGRTWLLADLRRTDLALIDPASRHANGHYDWSTPFAEGVVGGTRPGARRVVIDGRRDGSSVRMGAVAGDRRRRTSTARPVRGGAVGWMRRSAPAAGHRRAQSQPRRRPSASRCGSARASCVDVAPIPDFVRSDRRLTVAAETTILRSPAGSPGFRPRLAPGSAFDTFVVTPRRRRVDAVVPSAIAIRPAAARRRAVRVRRRLARRRAPAANRPALAVVERRVLAPDLAHRSRCPNPPRRRIAPEDLRRSADSHVDGWRARARPGDTG